MNARVLVEDWMWRLAENEGPPVDTSIGRLAERWRAERPGEVALPQTGDPVEVWLRAQARPGHLLQHAADLLLDVYRLHIEQQVPLDRDPTV